MPDALSSPLDLHSRLLEIAKKTVKQVADNPRPASAVLPGDVFPTPTTDPPYQR